MEIALSAFCGPSDIITPISASDEAMRSALGYRGPQNYLIPFRHYTRGDVARSAFRLQKLSYFNHAGARFIADHVDGNIWDSYYKFSFERNPWDKAVSFYYWKNQQEPRPSISEFIQSGSASSIRGFELYSRNSEIVVDRVFLYEELDAALEELVMRLRFSSMPLLPLAKANVRQDQRDYREILTPEDRDKIAKVFAREIAYFGYEW